MDEPVIVEDSLLAEKQPVGMGEKPLAGLKVIELYAIGPVPFVGQQLRQLGATVIRICPPQDRGIGIQIDAEADLLNHGKSQRAINLKESAGREALLQLLADADVLTEGFRPGVLERLGLDPEPLVEQCPALVIARLSGYGRHGAYAHRAGHDINYLALSGVLAAIGGPDEPVVPLNLIADFGGGAMHLLTGILASLVRRGISGKGGVVDTSILAGTLGLTTMMHSLLAGGRWNLSRQQNLLDGGLPFYRVYRCLDGQFIAAGALERPFFKALVELVGLSEVIDIDRQYEPQAWPGMLNALSSAFATRSRDEWAERALDSDCCVTPVLNFAEAARHPQNVSNGWISDDPFPHPGQLVAFS